MAYSAFLKIDPLKGESTDSKHLDYIDVLSFSWGVLQPARSTGSGHAESAQVIDFTFTHLLDRSSPSFLLASFNGQHFNNATIEYCGTTGTKSSFYLGTMTDVMVSSVKQTGNLSITPVPNKPTEEVTINFSKVEWRYNYIDSKSVSSQTSGGWDIKGNKAV